ncbi:MAG: hypothetical protein H7A00_07980 [Hahellaceae bacterium]|nr:hypothetical protein [Hahellaceae bacterium]
MPILLKVTAITTLKKPIANANKVTYRLAAHKDARIFNKSAIAANQKAGFAAKKGVTPPFF